MPLEERVALGKARERGDGVLPDRRRELLGERDGVVKSPGPLDAGPRDDGGASRFPEDASEPPYSVGVWGGAVDDVVAFQRLCFCVPVVHRDRDEDRALGLLHRCVVGAPDLPRHVLGPYGLEAPFYVGLRKVNEFSGEQRLEGSVTPVLLPRGDHKRGLVVPRRDHGPHSVAEAWACVQVDQGRPSRALGKTLGHP